MFLYLYQFDHAGSRAVAWLHPLYPCTHAWNPRETLSERIVNSHLAVWAIFAEACRADVDDVGIYFLARFVADTHSIHLQNRCAEVYFWTAGDFDKAFELVAS